MNAVEVSALTHKCMPGLSGPSALLRLQSDERLIAMTRRGQHAAFEVLFSRYQSRLLAFCRHMLGSREDAEDVLQEVFTAAFNAVLADEREINVRPWLYRIARNRSLNHLRRASAIGVDSMDVHYADNGLSTGERVLRRESFRQLLGDVKELPETQRTALLLREIDALSYEQIADAMETTVPSVKSLLVRARISLAEAAEARQLSCDEVRAAARRGRRGPDQARARPRAGTCAGASAAAASRSSCARTTTRSPRSSPSGRCCWPRSCCSPSSAPPPPPATSEPGPAPRRAPPGPPRALPAPGERAYPAACSPQARAPSPPRRSPDSPPRRSSRRARSRPNTSPAPRITIVLPPPSRPPCPRFAPANRSSCAPSRPAAQRRPQARGRRLRAAAPVLVTGQGAQARHPGTLPARRPLTTTPVPGPSRPPPRQSRRFRCR